MIRLLASIVLLVLVVIEAKAAVPNVVSLVALGLLLLSLALSGERQATKDVSYDRRRRSPKLPQ